MLKSKFFRNRIQHIGLFIILLSLAGGRSTLIAQLAKDHDKFFGCIVSNYIPDTFGEYWNQVTPENASKWGSVESTRNVYNWQSLDMAYDYAKDNGIPFRFHVLVWGKQQPGWIDALEPEDQRDEVEEWIALAGARYEDADYVEVVNEAIEWAPYDYYPSYYQALGGEGETGWDWVIWAFEQARYYFPNSKLLLNEYQLFGGNKSMSKYLEIVGLLQERGLIDGICEQGHFIETTSINTIKSRLDQMAATGLPIQITEFDINLADDQAQLLKYQSLFPVLWEHPAVEGITLWGYIQGQIWRTDGYLLRSDGTERPALEWLRDYLEQSDVKQAVRPETDMLLANYPNPFNPSTRISYSVSSQADVCLVVYDLLGKEIATLIEENQPAGEYQLEFNGTDLSSGDYICRLTAGGEIKTLKITLLK